MAVIAVLVAVAIPTFGSQLEKARQATDRANLRDAYASAKLAIQTADETTGTIKAALTAGSVAADDYDNKTYCFWYNADGANDGWTYVGTSDADEDATPTAAKALLLKATTAQNLDAKSLPASITYAARPSSVAGDAGVLIQITYAKASNVFTLSGIGFSADGKELIGGLVVTPSTQAVTPSTSGTTVPTFTVTLNGASVTASEYTVAANSADDTTALENLGLRIVDGALAQTESAIPSVPDSDVNAVLKFTHTESGKTTTATITFDAG